jgi:apolipoprotein N-acyltransferase
MLQLNAWLGAPGLTLATALVAALPVTLTGETGVRRWSGPSLAVLLLACGYGAGFARLSASVESTPPGVNVRLVQANIPQHHKWDPELRAAWFKRHLQLSANPSAVPLAAIIWPESAVPFLIDREPVVRDLMAEAAGNGVVLAGGDRFEREADPPVANNSLWAVDGEADVVARYDKVDLVPFGEYMPMRSLFGALGLQTLVQGTFDFVPGPGRRTIELEGLPSFSPLICYEAIYSGAATADDAPRPHWLLNITNDAWFGASWGPYQHLAMARTRAVEEGLPLVRAANTGISVVTDAYGRVQHRLDLGEAGIIDAALPGRLPPTLYARLGFPLILGLLVVACGLALALEAGARRGRPGNRESRRE